MRQETKSVLSWSFAVGPIVGILLLPLPGCTKSDGASHSRNQARSLVPAEDDARATALVEQLRSSDPYIAFNAPALLAEVGPPAIPPLRRELLKGDPRCHLLVIAALSMIGDQPSTDALRAYVASHRMRHRRQPMSVDLLRAARAGELAATERVNLAHARYVLVSMEHPELLRHISGAFYARPTPEALEEETMLYNDAERLFESAERQP